MKAGKGRGGERRGGTGKKRGGPARCPLGAVLGGTTRGGAPGSRSAGVRAGGRAQRWGRSAAGEMLGRAATRGWTAALCLLALLRE